MKSIVKKIIAKKGRVVFFLKLWLIWSRLYQWFELNFLTIEDKYMTFYGDVKDRHGVMISWERYCKRFKLKHYGGDKWYMLWDVISHPLRFLSREDGDCDDFALLGYYYFGDTVKYDNEKYNNLGMCTINWEDGSAHAVWVWLHENKKELMVVSNNEMVGVEDIRDLYGNKHGGIKWVSLIRVTQKGFKYTLKLDSVSSLEDYRNDWGME